MDDLEPFNCYICSHPYDHLLNKPVKGICGHTLCEQCRNSVLLQSNSKCPFCKLDLSFLDKVGNWQLVDELPELISQRSSVIHNIRNVKRDFVVCDRRLNDLSKELEEKRNNQRKLIEAMKSEVDSLEESIKNTKSSSMFQCSRCKVMMNQYAARICLQCGLTKNIFSKRKNAYIMNDTELAWREALCGGCILTSIHRGHSSTKLVTLLLTSEMYLNTEQLLNKLAIIPEGKRGEIEEKYNVLKNDCRKCLTLSDGYKLIEEAKSLLESAVNNVEESFTESVEIL